MRGIVNKPPHDRQPLTKPERSSRSPGNVAPRQEQPDWWRQIRESLVRAISLTVLGKASAYHMERFSADETYWNEVVAGQQNSPHATARLVAGIRVQK